MPKAKTRYNNHDTSMIRLVVFNKYTMEVMNKSTLLEYNMLKYKNNNNIQEMYRIYTRVE